MTVGELRIALAAFPDSAQVFSYWDTLRFDVYQVVEVDGHAIIDVDSGGPADYDNIYRDCSDRAQP